MCTSSIAAVPLFPGLRRFADGRNFAQWTGDDSKALMKVSISCASVPLQQIHVPILYIQVYLSAISGYVPDEMVKCLAVFLDMCYIFRRNGITISAIEKAQGLLSKFHQLRNIFVERGARTHTSLPRQHALSHFIVSIVDFGSPNGLCSSITESRHISAVKEPWRRSNRFNALAQMLVTIVRLDKINSLHRLLSLHGYLDGSVSYGMALSFEDSSGTHRLRCHGELGLDEDQDCDDADVEGEVTQDATLDEVQPAAGPRLASSVKLCATQGTPKIVWSLVSDQGLTLLSARGYSRHLDDLTTDIKQPQFREAFLTYLFALRYPNHAAPANICDQMRFTGKIFVYHSAIARYFAPSDACGAGGMQRQTIRCNPSWRGKPRYDTVFIAESNEPAMQGLLVAQVLLLFSFTDAVTSQEHSCALINWFNTVDDKPDPITGMWIVEREEVGGKRPLQVIDIRSIARGAHLLPVYGTGSLPPWISFTNSLDAFKQYYVNSYVDHHAHEMLSD